jgi:hypothetical protein
MTDPSVHPWFHAALSLLDLRRHDRVLLLAPGRPVHVRAVAGLIGNQGTLTVVEPDRGAAHTIAEKAPPVVEILALSPLGTERFGSFDALLCAPLAVLPLPPGAWADLPRQNLRPGGRFVLDLPGPDMIPDLRAAWLETGGDPAILAPLSGPSDDEIAAVLRNVGLRRVETVLGTHLLPLTSPFDLIDLVAPAIGLDEDARIELSHVLWARCRGRDQVETLVHRTRVHGIH